jgi:hypothetical protein
MRIGLIAASAAAMALCCAAPAFAGTDTTTQLVQVTESSPGVFDFTEGGFAGGATISGFFKGTDTDSDGQLNSFLGEVTDFHMSFSGNSKVGAFSLGLGSLFGLVYDLDGGPLGDGLDLAIEGVGASSFKDTYLAGPGPFARGACDGTNACGYVAGGVPEPGTWSMALVGLLGVGGALRLARAKQRAALAA